MISIAWLADGSADDFSVINQQDILDSVASTTQTLTLFLGAIAAISLLVGGIGIHEHHAGVGARAHA